MSSLLLLWIFPYDCIVFIAVCFFFLLLHTIVPTLLPMSLKWHHHGWWLLTSCKNHKNNSFSFLMESPKPACSKCFATFFFYPQGFFCDTRNSMLHCVRTTISRIQKLNSSQELKNISMNKHYSVRLYFLTVCVSNSCRYWRTGSISRCCWEGDSISEH